MQIWSSHWANWEDNLKNENNLKNEENLKNDDDLKNEEYINTKDNLKNEDNLIAKTVPSPSLHNLSYICFMLWYISIKTTSEIVTFDPLLALLRSSVDYLWLYL